MNEYISVQSPMELHPCLLSRQLLQTFASIATVGCVCRCQPLLVIIISAQLLQVGKSDCGYVHMPNDSVFEVGRGQPMISGCSMLVDYKDSKGLKLCGAAQCWVITYPLYSALAQAHTQAHTQAHPLSITH